MSGITLAALHIEPMKQAKPVFPDPNHDHGRCAEDAFLHAEKVCTGRGQKFTPIRRQVLGALLSSHRPLGAYEVIDELAKTMPRPAPDYCLSRAGFPDGERPRSPHRKPQRVSGLRP